MKTNEHTSVHPQETTVLTSIPIDYRAYRSRNCKPELLRTEWLYSYIDSVEGTERTEKLHDCRSFAWFARHVSDGSVRVMSNSCRLRWCPICSQARSSFLIGQVKDWLNSVKNPKFLTLTMKHTNAPLEHQIKWLYQHFRKFRQRKSIKRDLKGGIWFFQLKKTKSAEPWHPHLHCVIDATYIPQKRLSDEWEAQTKTSSIVDIRAVKSNEKVAGYVSRYCSRPAQLKDFSDDEVIEIFTVFHGRRLCGTWGTGRKVSLRPARCADKAEWESVGSWKAVVEQRDTLPRARMILKAFMTNDTVPQGIYVKPLKADIDKYTDEELPHVGIEDFRGSFEEFF